MASAGLPSSHIVDHAKQLISHGPILLSKLFSLKAHLLTLPKRNLYLKDSEWNKLRYRLEKRFPALPDFNKITGSSTFLSNIAEIRSDLTSCFNIFCCVADFIKSAKEVLEKIPKFLLEFRMRRNRPLLLIWARIFVIYMKIVYLLDLVPEKFVVLPMYCAASQIGGYEISIQQLEEIRSLLVDGDNFQRKCIDFFAPLRQHIGVIILEMKDTIFSLSDPESIRNNNVFNPIYDRNNMGLPSNRVLTTSNDSSLYSETIELNFYYEFAVLGIIVAPHCLYDENILAVLEEVVKYRALIPLYRDLSINIHIELEKVSFLFPTEVDKFQIPKGFKLANRLKQISRDSLKVVGKMQKKRRLVVLHDLLIWGNLLQISPGCVGPKLPVILAACNLLKGEVVAFFRHYSGFLCRKDSRAYYDILTFKDGEDISDCLHALYLLENILHRADVTIVNYYLEYLFRADFESLQQFEDLFLNHFSGMIHMYENIARCTESYHLYHKDDATEILKISSSIQDEFLKLVLISSNPSILSAMNIHAQKFEQFLQLMYVISDHCIFCCDKLRTQYQLECINPFQAGWFRPAWLEVFANCIRSTSLNSSFGVFSRNKQRNYNAMMFLRPMQDILFNLELGNPSVLTETSRSEMQELGDAAIMFADTMLTYVTDFVKASIKTLWEYLRALEAQYHPIEVINRILRFQSGSSDPQQNNFVPGMESDLWATSQIKEFIKLQEHLSNILSGISKTLPSTIQIYTRIYKVEQFVYENIIAHFRGYLVDHFSTVDRSYLCRFSMGVTRFTHSLLALQFIAQSLPNSSFSMALKELVHLDIVPPNVIPPTGITVAELSSKISMPGGMNSTIIGIISSWFLEVYRQIGCNDESHGFAYVPHRKLFTNLTRLKKLRTLNNVKRGQFALKTNTSLFTSATSTTSHDDFGIEIYLSHDELVALVRVIGVQGMRIIESLLLDEVFQEMMKLLNYLNEDGEYISMFEGRLSVDPSVASKISRLQECRKCLRSIGVALILREHFIHAVKDVMSIADHDIFSTVVAAADTCNVWSDSSLDKRSLFYTLCHNFGVGDIRDISLFTSLYGRFQDKKMSFNDIKVLYKTLPTIGAALLVDPRTWQNNKYINDLALFEADEYSVQYALAKLFVFNHNVVTGSVISHCDQHLMGVTLASISSISELILSEDNDDFEEVSLFEKLNIDAKQHLSATDGVGRFQFSSPIDDSVLTMLAGSPLQSSVIKPRDTTIIRGTSLRDCSNYICKGYLKRAANALLTARCSTDSSRWDLPFAAITVLLEQFISLLPGGIRPGHLEQYLPYDIMHFDLVDVAVGKFYPSGNYSEFTSVSSREVQNFSSSADPALRTMD